MEREIIHRKIDAAGKGFFILLAEVDILVHTHNVYTKLCHAKNNLTGSSFCIRAMLTFQLCCLGRGVQS